VSAFSCSFDLALTQDRLDRAIDARLLELRRVLELFGHGLAAQVEQVLLLLGQLVRQAVVSFADSL
jgi:hypothetical protein